MSTYLRIIKVINIVFIIFTIVAIFLTFMEFFATGELHPNITLYEYQIMQYEMFLLSLLFFFLNIVLISALKLFRVRVEKLNYINLILSGVLLFIRLVVYCFSVM